MNRSILLVGKLHHQMLLLLTKSDRWYCSLLLALIIKSGDRNWIQLTSCFPRYRQTVRKTVVIFKIDAQCCVVCLYDTELQTWFNGYMFRLAANILEVLSADIS